MAMRSRRITCKTHPWVSDKQTDLLGPSAAQLWSKTYVGISGNEVADGLTRQAVESGTDHGQMTVANDHMISIRQAMVKQWQHVWRTGDTGRFAHSIQPVVSVKPFFYWKFIYSNNVSIKKIKNLKCP
jgi:hypothetical protein